ncbi:hypothetical protein O7615_17660 [Micromonospora sp. WMMD1082]|nr:alpha/beta fold hydrolase [Micromonospora sp. WMMD1082]MDG4795694.1 hypothetical protein [Micromonospora sp. WMMD1082]
MSDLLASIDGPIVLVGHSYGGMVASNAAVGNDNVKALVYVAALAPEKGENTPDLLGKFPGATLGEHLYEMPLSDGTADVYVDAESYHEHFAADLPAEQVALDAATQRAFNTSALNEAPASRPGRPSRPGSSRRSWTPPSRSRRSASWPSEPTRERRSKSPAPHTRFRPLSPKRWQTSSSAPPPPPPEPVARAAKPNRKDEPGSHGLTIDSPPEGESRMPTVTVPRIGREPLHESGSSPCGVYAKGGTIGRSESEGFDLLIALGWSHVRSTRFLLHIGG